MEAPRGRGADADFGGDQIVFDTDADETKGLVGFFLRETRVDGGVQFARTPREPTLMLYLMTWIALCVPSATAPSAEEARTESFLMRFADVDRDKVVFTFEGDLWLAWSAGGDAFRLTRSVGEERFAKLSPDGQTIAFTGEYDGGTDVYVMPVTGGTPKRLTWHPAADEVLEWFPDGKHILFRSRREYPFRVDMIYKVSVDGGTEQKLPVDQAGLTTISPDGKSIAYCRISREFRTWKRHQGGTAQDIWLGSLEAKDYRKITDWVGTDSYPMWWGDGVYFLSDRRFGTLNLYRYDVSTGDVKALTEYKDYDVKFPSIGHSQIVYQYGERLHILDLHKEVTRPVPIRITSDAAPVREEWVEAGAHTGSFGLSPDGSRVVIETRGEIVTAPVKEGRPIRLTEASVSREKSAAWSPDGKWIVFLSDRTGEDELYLASSDGRGEVRRLTQDGGRFRMQPVWSPDSRRIAFADKTMTLSVVDVESCVVTAVDRGEVDDGWERWGIQDYVFSPDGGWLAYTKLEASGNESIFLRALEAGKTHRVTSPRTTDFSPSFSPDGRYLYFLSHRSFSPVMDRIDQNHAFLDVCKPYLVVLSSRAASPFAPKEASASSVGEPEDTLDAPAIDVEGIERRIVDIPGVPAGNYFRLEATSEGFVCLSRPEPTFLKYQNVNDRTTDPHDLHGYALADRSFSKLMTGIENYHLSADRKKLVYRAGATFGVVDAGKPANVGDGKIDLSAVKIRVDRRAEFAQIFREAWRVQRDWFYDPGMHGENWSAVGEKYAKFVPYCGDRSDLNYLIGEMIGELNAGHTYIQGGALSDRGPRVDTGLLGVDFELPPSAAYHRIQRIIPGTPGDAAEVSPLDHPGCPVREGHYLIAVDGRDLRATDNVYAALENKAGMIVEITYNDRPSPEGAKTHLVRTIGSERAIRYRAWVEDNRRKVEELSGGRVGYLHIPDMMEGGLIEFARGFFPQHDREGLIIDDRYNTGGFVGDMIIDRLDRKLWAMIQPREGKPVRSPERAFHGHLAVLINEGTASNGEYFAEAIKRAGLATLIGTRTWGGAIGIEPHQDFVDRGQTTPPQFAPFGLDGTWLIEGHGVEPDIVLDNAPAEVLAGHDAQLHRAVEHLLKRIEEEPKRIPDRPAYPVKTKPGA